LAYDRLRGVMVEPSGDFLTEKHIHGALIGEGGEIRRNSEEDVLFHETRYQSS